MHRSSDLARRILVILGTLVGIVASFFGSGAAGGTKIQDAADGAFAADATLLSPGTPAFSIWSVIYLGTLAYAVYQALPSQAARPLHRAVGWWLLAAGLLNGTWILVAQAGLLPLSLLVIAVLLAVLVAAFVRLRTHPAEGLVDAIVVHGTIGLYLGWVLIATVANVTALLVASGFDGWGLSPEAWAVAVLVVAGAVAIALAVWDHGRLAPAASTAWGITWIGVARALGEPESTVVAIAAFFVAGAIVVTAVVARVVDARPAGSTPTADPAPAGARTR